MKTTQLNFLIAIIALISTPLYSQTLTYEQAKNDLLQLKEGITTYNPALNTYNPHFETEAASLIDQLPEKEISSLQFFQFVSRLCALSNEGHFALGDWSDAVHAGFLANEYLYMPVSVNVSKNRLFVWIDISKEQSLARGDEIMAINGVSADSILSIFQYYLPADGNITTYVNRNVELGFSWMYYLYVDQPEVFTFTIKDTDGATKDVSITALERDTQFDNFARYYPERSAQEEENIFHTLNHENQTSYLTLPSFDYAKVKEHDIKSNKFYKSIFAEIADNQSKNLVIDLRNNTGGRNELADDMVPYILKNTTDTFLKRTISWEGKEKNYKMPKPSKLSFKGNIYVLVNGRTYSAGSTLARYLKEYGNAVVIGEETGTRYEGFAAGSKQYITLSNSQIKIGIPRYHILFPASKLQMTSNQGLIPDYVINFSVNDYLDDTDLHMNKAKALIAAHNISND